MKQKIWRKQAEEHIFDMKILIILSFLPTLSAQGFGDRCKYTFYAVMNTILRKNPQILAVKFSTVVFT